MTAVPLRVLIVERSPGDLGACSVLLDRCPSPSFRTRAVGSVSEALSALAGHGCDVVLLDLDLPDARGLDGLERLTAAEPDVPVIVLTNRSDDETGLRAIQMGAGDYLDRGKIEGGLLVRSIRYAIERKASEIEIRKLNVSLKRRVEELQTIFDTVPIGIAISDDPEGFHIRGNPANERILGVPRGGELSLRTRAGEEPPYRATRDGREVSLGDLPMQMALSGKVVRGQVLDVRRPDGTAVRLIAHAEPLLDERGSPRGAVGAFVDITDLTRAEAALRESEARLQGILDATRESIWLFSPEGTILLANETALARFGKRAEEILNRNFVDFVPPALAESRMKRIAETVMTKQPVTFEDERDGLSFQHTFYPIFGLEGEVAAITSFSRDVTERNRAQTELEWLASFPKRNPNPIVELDTDGRVVYANPTCESLFPDVRTLQTGHPWLIGWESTVRPLMEHQAKVAVRDVEVEGSWYQQSFHFIESARRIRLYGSDITERKRVEVQLRETKEFLEKLIRYANAPIIVWDPGHRITEFNHAFERLTGYRAEEVLGRDLSILFPDSGREGSLAQIARTLEGENWESVEIPILQKDGGVRLVLWNSANIYVGEAKTLGATIAQGLDITARKEAEGKLKASLEEKEVLLKEIHHRVKNNLQIIASMLNLQMGALRDEATRAPLLESQGRVRTLALIHEKLYGSADLSKIPFDEYISDLATSLVSSYLGPSSRVRLDLDLERIPLGIETSIPLSLILNELISNALKHAFPGGREGRIAIRLKRSESSSLEVSVRDDGVGMPGDLAVETAGTLGLQLVGVLVRQLRADLNIHREGGTKFRITLREDS
jgi:PAS domain S-box-containing protein